MQCGAYGMPEWEAPGVLDQGHAICSRELHSFEKQILVQYWTLGETECLTTGTKEPRILVPVMSWVMLGPPSNEVR